MGDDQKIPKTQDWVKARAECSLDQLFIMLSVVVESDTKTADSRADNDLEFAIKNVTVNGFMVARTVNAGGILESEVIAFDRKREAIEVSHRTPNGSKPMFTITPHVDTQGECKFLVDRTPLEAWQVSKLALENFFFERGGLSPKPLK